MRNHFTITISDVHGARSYSFKQFFKRFAWFLILLFLVIWAGGVTLILWLSSQAKDIEVQHREAVSVYELSLADTKRDYIHLSSEKRLLEQELADKTKQAEFLDETLQGLEELIGTANSTVEEPQSNIEDRVKLVQLGALGKSLMLEMLPNGRPVQDFVGVSSSYGWRTHPVKGTKQFHRGIDYRGEKGAPVIATAVGVVEFAGFHKTSGFGNYVIVSHANGFKTHYGHLSRIDVKTGEFVRQGQVIAGIGSTGLSSGNHLHYEVSFVQRKLDPSPFVGWNLQNYDSVIEEVKGVPWGSLSQAVNEQVQKVEKQLLHRGVSLVESSTN